MALSGEDASSQVVHPGILFTDPVRVATRLELGRTLASAGDRVKAKAALEDFLAVWKGADSEIPILKQVQTEYAGLM